MSSNLSCFKAYDIRGRVPDELNPNLVRLIGNATAIRLGPGPLVVGRDVRLSSPMLQAALMDGITAAGRHVIDIGLCGTEEVYFQTAHLGAAGGIMVTASHNPMDYNGLKLVREDAKPISGDSGLLAIRDAAADGEFIAAPALGDIIPLADKSNYVQHLLTYVDLVALKPLKIVVNSGSGGAGMIIDELSQHLPFDFVRIQHEPDGTFPNGIPNPLLPENRNATADAVRAHGADFGVAWDGDFDRCFFFDATGRFIEGYYVVGLLASALLARHPGEKVIHDPRLTWNTIEIVRRAGGIPIQSKAGHAFIKERMRAENAVYGGEMSAHHYFRDFAYCDSGMIPWLLLAGLMSQSEKSLAEMVEDRIAAYPCSGEINFKVANTEEAITRVLAHLASSSPKLDHIDGVGADFGDWRFNLRSSNTEPLLRLNVETRASPKGVLDRVDELRNIINGR